MNRLIGVLMVLGCLLLTALSLALTFAAIFGWINSGDVVGRIVGGICLGSLSCSCAMMCLIGVQMVREG